MTHEARCRDWADKGECAFNRAFMLKECAAQCSESAPEHPFQTAEVCEVAGAGTALGGLYYRAHGLMRRRASYHIFGRWPHVLLYQPPEGEEVHWTAFLCAPHLNVSANAPYYFMRTPSAAWEVVGGARPAPHVRCAVCRVGRVV